MISNKYTYEYDFDKCNILRLTISIESKQIVYYCKPSSNNKVIFTEVLYN